MGEYSDIDSYSNLSKEELIKLLRIRDDVQSEQEPNLHVSEKDYIKKIIAQIITLLFNSEEREPISKSMKLLMDCFDADWAYIALFEKEKQKIKFICEIASPWTTGKSKGPLELTYDKIPWITNAILSGQDIIIPDTSSLPPEAIVDKSQIDVQHLLSLFMMPLYFQNEVQGFIGVETIRFHRHWTKQEREDMHLVASMFSIVVERKLTENIMEESRKSLSELSTKFKHFFESLPLGVELYDANGYMVDTNEADAKIFETSQENLIGINLHDNPNLPLHIKDDIKHGVERFNFPLIYNFGKIKNYYNFNADVGGVTKYLNVKGLTLNDQEFGKIGYLFIVSDNTEAYLKSEQMGNQLTTLKAVLLGGHSLIGEYDLQTGVMFIDPNLNDRTTGIHFFDLMRNKTWMTLSELTDITSFDAKGPNSYSHFNDIVEGKSDSCSIIGKVTLDGEIYWIRINARAYKKRENGMPDKIICYVVNITEEKLLEEKLQHAESEACRSELEKQKAQEADNLKSTFLANMSHEIRTPLNAIVGFSSIIAETNDEQEKNNFLTIINENSELLLRLITDILDFSKIESGKLDYLLTVVSIKKICSEQYAVHSLKASSQLRILFDPNLPDIYLYTDPRRVTQVISNLLTNARKFTNEGVITISYHQEDNLLKVEISDTGIGIQEEFLSSIFDRFVKVDSFKQGTGLGLPICKTIIEALNGQIGVTSTFGEGSTFWFTLPLEGQR